jgi:hypothetical protein
MMNAAEILFGKDEKGVTGRINDFTADSWFADYRYHLGTATKDDVLIVDDYKEDYYDENGSLPESYHVITNNKFKTLGYDNKTYGYVNSEDGLGRFYAFDKDGNIDTNDKLTVGDGEVIVRLDGSFGLLKNDGNISGLDMTSSNITLGKEIWAQASNTTMTSLKTIEDVINYSKNAE